MRFSRVLVVLKSYLGDAVMATPLIDCLVSASEEVHVLAGGGAADVLRRQPGNLQFLRERETTKPAELVALAKEIRGFRFDAAFIVNRSFRSALAVRLAKVPIRVGHATEGRRPLLTHGVPYDPDKNEAECYNDLARSLCLAPASQPFVVVTDEERSTGAKLLDGASVGIQPGARYEQKQVPLDRWIDLGRWIHGRGLRIALIGGPDETGACERLASELGCGCVNLAGRCTIRETLGVMANLRLMAGSDTGAMHLAAGAGCPTLTVFGPNPASKWGHDYPPHRVLSAPEGAISNVTSDEIIQAAQAILKG